MKKEKKRILFRVIFTIILFGILYENGERKSQNFSVKVQQHKRMKWICN